MKRSIRRFALVVFLAAACGFAGSAFADVRDDLFTAWQHMLGARYVSDSTITDAGGKVTKNHVEYDTMDRVHLKNDRVEMIYVPEGLWTRHEGGQWEKVPLAMNAMMKQILPKTLEEMRAGMKNFKDEGMSTLNGQPVRVVSFDEDSRVMGFIHVVAHERVSLDSAGRIVHIESDSEAMGHKSHNVQDIRYDDSLHVVAPQ